MSTYAVIKTGGKQYRVQQGETLLIERLPDAEGDTVTLTPLLYVDGETVLDGDALSTVSVQGTIVAHERGPKLRIVKFKPKRGYKRRNGHRQELTRIQIAAIGSGTESVAAATTTEPGATATATEPGATATATEPGATATATEEVGSGS
jgi:large subunit ribosomal protein L21